ncbi:hypothetical protein JCM8547_000731 [Rhodosporidiobolus lusitaniae]
MPFKPVAGIPGIAFGTGSTWRSNPRPVREDGIAPAVVDTIKAAAEAGFRHFDGAENYRNEKSVGAGLKATGIPRSELYIVSKVHPSLGKVEEEIKRQLDLFGVDYLDLYLIHTPKAASQAGISLLEAWKSLEALADQGVIKAIGVSNYGPDDFDAFLPSARIKPIVNQISIYPYIYHRQLPIIEYSERNGIAIEAYELSSSLLRDTEKGGPLDPVLNGIVETLAKEGTSATLGQVLLAWAAAKGWIPLTTSSKPSRLQECIAAGDLALTPEQVAAIDAAGKEGAEKGYGQYTSWK